MSLFQTAEPPFRFRQGSRPLLISMPHVGTHVPPALAERFTAEARHVPDTDWHLERLYDFADALGASVLVATHSRYVVDLNRPPDDQNLYPGQDTTGLCPVDTFDKTPIYAAGDLPGAPEIAARRDAIWHPYHRQLQAELDRLKAAHGTIALWDAHSIRSVLPLQERVASVADKADLQEVYNTERHLLYVACTRARDRLLVTGIKPGSVFLEDLETPAR